MVVQKTRRLISAYLDLTVLRMNLKGLKRLRTVGYKGLQAYLCRFKLAQGAQDAFANWRFRRFLKAFEIFFAILQQLPVLRTTPVQAEEIQVGNLCFPLRL